MSGLCTTNGWHWYCDVHDTHGNADSQEEAIAVSDAHTEHKELVDEDSEGCEISIIQLVLTKSGRTP